MTAAVVFDMDGVLVDTNEVHERVWQEWFDVTGHDPGPRGVRGVLGRRGTDVLREILGEDRLDEVDRIQQTLEDRGDDILLETPPPLFPGAEELIVGLSDAGVPMAVATSARRWVVDHHLGPLVARFDTIVTAEQVEHGKPNPETYLSAARQLGMRPEHCTVLEDAVPGVQAAVAAGMDVIGVAGMTSAQALRDAGATRTVQTLTELDPEDLCRNGT